MLTFKLSVAVPFSKSFLTNSKYSLALTFFTTLVVLDLFGNKELKSLDGAEELENPEELVGIEELDDTGNFDGIKEPEEPEGAENFRYAKNPTINSAATHRIKKPMRTQRCHGSNDVESSSSSRRSRNSFSRKFDI